MEVPDFYNGDYIYFIPGWGNGSIDPKIITAPKVAFPHTKE